MSDPNDTFTEGSLIRVEHAGESVLAKVLSRDRGFLQVETETGAQIRIKTAKVRLQMPSDLALERGSQTSNSQLEELKDMVISARQTIDLETLWELVSDEDIEGFTVLELAALWFGEVGAARFFAMAEALEEDSIYFKCRVDRYRPRNQRQVEAERARLSAESKRLEVRERMLSLVSDALQGREGAQDGLRSESSCQKQIDLLFDFAAHGDTFSDKKMAVDLIGDINTYVRPRSFAGTAGGAFDLLLAMGLVEPHENLALRRHRIRTEFDGELLHQACQLAAAPPAVDSHLLDLSHLETFTIDSPTTQDMDDALHIRRAEDGTWELGIHITDVGALIQPGSPLDVEAAKRGSSVYLPTGVIPMLPPILSDQRLSLLPREPRLTTSLLVRLSDQGRIVSSRVTPALICVKHRLTYQQADLVLVDPTQSLHDELSQLEQIARDHHAMRIEQGAISIDLPEVKIRVRDGKIILERLETSSSRFLVAELMVLAGRLTADFCLTQGIPTVFRVQDHDIHSHGLTYLDTIDNELVRYIEMTRYMRRGELKSQSSPHMGLGLPAYVQATSPIRRYADLAVNFQLRRFLRGDSLAFSSEAIVAVAARAEIAAQECVGAQRETQSYWALEYIRRQGESLLEATVLYYDPQSVRSMLPIVLNETLIRTQLPARNLVVGQQIQVRPTHVDPRRDLLRVELA